MISFAFTCVQMTNVSVSEFYSEPELKAHTDVREGYIFLCNSKQIQWAYISKCWSIHLSYGK